MTSNPANIQAPKGKLGILLPGMGAVANTFVAGIYNVRRGLGDPVGSLTQMGTIEVDGKTLPIKDFLPLYDIENMVFGGWDIHGEDGYQVAKRAGVLRPEHLKPIKKELQALKPMPAVFNQEWVRRLDGPNVKTETNKFKQAQALIADIARFKEENGCDRLVAVWCGSTEVHTEIAEVHLSPEAFVQGMHDNHEKISPSMIYAYAHIMSDVPYANGAPNLALDIPALIKLAEDRNVPIIGKDFKTGQTLIKTILAPGFKARMIGLNGWYSTNILGNRDGMVLEDPGSFKSKEVSKLSVLESILQKDQHPALYGNIHHKVRIDYYPPRGDNKEGWDNIDIFGWLGYEMQIKVNFLCRDSILAAPLVLDLALFLDLAHRAGKGGVQEWLSFYFKSPQSISGSFPEHDIFIQKNTLEDTLREMAAGDSNA